MNLCQWILSHYLIDEIGEKTASSIIEFFKDEDNRNL